MNTPPGLKRTVESLARVAQTSQASARGVKALEATRIFVERPCFSFTELSLSDDEQAALCVIPSRAVVAQFPTWTRMQRPVRRSSRRAARPLQAVMAAGMAWLALPGCNTPQVAQAEVEQAQAAGEEAPVVMTESEQVGHGDGFNNSVPRAGAGSMHVARRGKAGDPLDSAGRTSPTAGLRAQAVLSLPRQMSARRAIAAMPPDAARSVPSAQLALLEQARAAMDREEFKTALGLYKHVLSKAPTQVDALFGAALASHELKDVKGADVFLKRALTAQPNHPLANVLAGFTDQLGHRYSRAREHYARFLAVESSGARADEIRAVLGTLPSPAGATIASGR